MEIELSSHFVRQAKRLSPQEQMRLSQRLEWFRRDPTDRRLRVHGLTGRFKGLLSFSVTHSKRVVFQLVKTNVALLVDVGSHDQVYR